VPRVNIVKHVKMDGHWAIRSIPRKASGAFDWGALPDGRYVIEWHENGHRRREAAGTTSAEALEAQRKKRHELEGVRLGGEPRPPVEETPPARPLRKPIGHYLDQVETLKKRNTHRKYEAVLDRLVELRSGGSECRRTLPCTTSSLGRSSFDATAGLASRVSCSFRRR
jgi:transposase